MDLIATLWTWLIIALFIAICIKVVAKVTCGRYTIKEDLSNKTVLITGATRGIGLVAARELARHGASIHLLCRNVSKAETVCEEIKRETGNDRVFVWSLDTSRLDSVREFARKFLATSHPIDILINNAGVAWIQERQLTEDGLEMTMATNHFGHFLLTNLLLDRIKKSEGGSRIVNVSSLAHLLSNIDLNDINLEKNYSSSRAYNCSKLANVIFTKQLARNLFNTKITANCLHPGSVDTDLFRSVSRWMQPLIPIFSLWFKTVEEGADSILHLAVAPELEMVTGKYFWDCKPSMVSRQANDDVFAEKFWKISEELTGCNYSWSQYKDKEPMDT